jgi:signal transduction histidine kinase
MNRLLRESPGLTRAFALSVFGLIVAQLASHYDQPLDWGIAILYGAAVAVSMQWPIIMGGTGVRVGFVWGLTLEAIWHHGPATAVMAILVEFGVRVLAFNQGRYYWEWYRPVLRALSLLAAYGLQMVVEGTAIPHAHAPLTYLETPAVIMAYVFWALLNAQWSWIKPKGNRSPVSEFFRCLQQTWWTPLLFMAVAGVAAWVHSTGYPLTVVVTVALVWLQAQIGPVFTAMNQDRGIAHLVHTSAPQDPGQRATVHRVLRTAHTLGRSLGLSAPELRVLGYAALLQELPADRNRAPLWLPTAPTPDQVEVLRSRLADTIELVESDGSLQEVALVIGYRFAAYDGQGYPDVSGEAIPAAAQVLAAANAMVWVASGEAGPRTSTAAVEWLRRQTPTRFSPQVLSAMSQVFVDPEPAVDVARGLPEAVRQLQGLVGESASPSPLFTGLRRFWHQVRGQAGLGPDLPDEVQAVARLATYFASSTHARETAHIVAEAAGQLIGGKAAVAVREGGDTELNLRVRAVYNFGAFNPLGLTLDLYGGALSRSMLDQAPYQVADIREVQSPFAEELARAEGVRSALFVPLVHRNRMTGMIFIGLTRYHWFTPREVGLIHLMAGQAAAALENARLIEEAEERLAHISSLKAFTDALLDNLNSSILVVDPEGRLVMVNASAKERFGGELPLAMGQPLPEPLAAATRLAGALGGEEVPEKDVTWGHAILEMQAVPLRDERGVMTGAMCLARDVTQVRSMEEQVRRVENLAAVGELAAGAAHEIRNPLTSIRGFIQLLQARATRADGDYFQIILNEIDRIDGIIRDMLLLARPTSVLRVETDMRTLVDEVLLMQQTGLERQNITVVKTIDPEVGPAAVDAKMFRQLLLNVVINAMQAMPYGGTLRLCMRTEGDGGVALEVSDTGVGIPPENLKRLFVPFFTTKEEGTGLGLALCYSIVQAHGGKIDVQSHLGMGTIFTIMLPPK